MDGAAAVFPLPTPKILRFALRTLPAQLGARLGPLLTLRLGFRLGMRVPPGLYRLWRDRRLLKGSHWNVKFFNFS